MMKFLPILGLLFLQQWSFPLHRTAQASGAPCSALPFSDTFTRSNGPLGSPWALSSGGTFAIVSNSAQITAGTGSGQNAWPSGCPGWTSSHYAQATFTSFVAGATIGLTVNTIDGLNYYEADCSTGGGCSVVAHIGGGDTFIGVFSAGVAQGDVVCFEQDSGTSVKLKVNGTYANTLSVSGLTAGSSGGGIWAGATSSPASSLTAFSTGNGVCP